jgi:beta-glucosidase
MKTKLSLLLLLALSVPLCAHNFDRQIDDLLAKMTLEEKIGQLNQLSCDAFGDDLRMKVEKGNVGCILNELDAKTINAIQKVAVEKSA